MSCDKLLSKNPQWCIQAAAAAQLLWSRLEEHLLDSAQTRADPVETQHPLQVLVS